MVLNAGKRKQMESVNCTLKVRSCTRDRILFDCLEMALPFPVKKEALPALNLVPFTEDLNQEILQVNNLKPGTYDLYIDKVLVDNYDADQLKEGVNLAINPKTPQYSQSLQVMKLCSEYQSVQAILRNFPYVELKNMRGYKGKIQDFESVKAFIQEKIPLTTSPHLKLSYELYLVNKPKQGFYKTQLKEVRDKIYQANIPVYHSFELIKNNTK